MKEEFTWQFGEPISREEKEATFKTKFPFKKECLDEQIDRITANETIESLMQQLPATIPFDDLQQAKLVIRKLTDLVWQAGYVVYKNPGERDFEAVSVKYVTYPTLILTLHYLLKELC